RVEQQDPCHPAQRLRLPRRGLPQPQGHRELSANAAPKRQITHTLIREDPQKRGLAAPFLQIAEKPDQARPPPRLRRKRASRISTTPGPAVHRKMLRNRSGICCSDSESNWPATRPAIR